MYYESWVNKLSFAFYCVPIGYLEREICFSKHEEAKSAWSNPLSMKVKLLKCTKQEATWLSHTHTSVNLFFVLFNAFFRFFSSLKDINKYIPHKLYRYFVMSSSSILFFHVQWVAVSKAVFKIEIETFHVLCWNGPSN